MSEIKLFSIIRYSGYLGIVRNINSDELELDAQLFGYIGNNLAGLLKKEYTGIDCLDFDDVNIEKDINKIDIEREGLKLVYKENNSRYYVYIKDRDIRTIKVYKSNGKWMLNKEGMLLDRELLVKAESIIRGLESGRK